MIKLLNTSEHLQTAASSGHPRVLPTMWVVHVERYGKIPDAFCAVGAFRKTRQRTDRSITMYRREFIKQKVYVGGWAA